MPVPVISIVGKKKSGKTTLMEKLLPELKRRGIKAGTIKHDAHDFEMDRPGKDTYRHFAAGAEAVLIASAGKLALVKRLGGEVSLDDLVSGYMSGVELVLTEGYRSSDKPKVEVLRKGQEPPLCGPADNLVALITDAELDLKVPTFGWEEISELADFIVKKFFPDRG